MYENTISEILKAQTDKEELGKIVENNSGLVWSIVKRFRGRGYELSLIHISEPTRP